MDLKILKGVINYSRVIMTVQLLVMKDKVSSKQHFFTRLTGTLQKTEKFFVSHLCTISCPFSFCRKHRIFVPSKTSNRDMKWSGKRLKSLQDPMCIPKQLCFLCPMCERFGGKWPGTGTPQATEGPEEISHGQSVLKCWKQKEFFSVYDECFELPGHQPIPPSLQNLL